MSSLKNIKEKEKTGWVKIVKHNIKNEIQKYYHIEHTTLEEKNMH